MVPSNCKNTHRFYVPGLPALSAQSSVVSRGERSCVQAVQCRFLSERSAIARDVSVAIGDWMFHEGRPAVRDDYGQWEVALHRRDSPLEHNRGMYGSHFTHGDFVRVSSIVIAYARDYFDDKSKYGACLTGRACVAQCVEKGNYRIGRGPRE